MAHEPRNRALVDRSRTLGRHVRPARRAPHRRPRRLPSGGDGGGRCAHRRRRRRPGDPVRRGPRASAPATSPRRWTTCRPSSRPTRCRSGPGCSTPTATRSRRSTTRTGSTSRSTRSRGPWSRRSSRSRTTASTSTARSTSRARVRALVTNQANDGVVQGGSSITQQMVKLTLLTQAKTKAERAAATDDTYARKLRELRYAIAFEQNYSKDWILERYLNIAYFGDGTYGVQSAARHYFGVNAKNLNLRQSAMLAGLVKNPTGYDPTNSPDRALARRNVVLDRMAELNVITREKAEKTKETDARPPRRRRPRTAACTPARRSSATTPGTTCSTTRRSATTVAERKTAAQVRRPDHPHHHRPRRPGGGRQGRRRPRRPARPGRRRARDGRARHRRREGDRPVAADGPQREEGRDLPQLRRADEVRRLRRLPGRLDVQAVRARRRDRGGHPAARRRSTRRRR